MVRSTNPGVYTDSNNESASSENEILGNGEGKKEGKKSKEKKEKKRRENAASEVAEGVVMNICEADEGWKRDWTREIQK